MNNIQIFEYNGSPISFDNGETRMVNATEMAKPFGKQAKDWLKTQSTKEFLATLSEVKKILSHDLVQVTHGDHGGTWMHEDVALEFARWLSPKFAIWCNERIKDLVSSNLVPKTFRQALLLAARQQEQIEEQQRLLANLEKENTFMAEENNKKVLIIEAQQEEIEDQKEQIEVMKEKVSYADEILSSPNSVTVTQIAQDYGMSAVSFNKLLEDLGVQFRSNGQWVLYAKYKQDGFVQSKTIEYQDKYGRTHTKMNTQWNQKGRMFLYQFLKKHDIIPISEQ